MQVFDLFSSVLRWVLVEDFLISHFLKSGTELFIFHWVRQRVLYMKKIGIMSRFFRVIQSTPNLRNNVEF